MTKLSRAASTTALLTSRSELISRIRSSCVSRRFNNRKLPPVIRMIGVFAPVVHLEKKHAQLGIEFRQRERGIRLPLRCAPNREKWDCGSEFTFFKKSVITSFITLFKAVTENPLPQAGIRRTIDV